MSILPTRRCSSLALLLCLLLPPALRAQSGGGAFYDEPKASRALPVEAPTPMDDEGHPRPLPTPVNPSGERPSFRPGTRPNDLKLDTVPPLRQPVSAPWTLPGIIERALDANPDLLTARLNVERQIGQRLQLRSRLLPRLAVTGSYVHRDQGLIDRSPQEDQVPPNERSAIAQDSFDLSVEVRYLLFDGGSNIADARAGKLGQERALWQLEDTAYRTIALVRQAYYAILLRRSLGNVQNEARTLIRRQLDISQKRFKAGEITEFDTLRVQAELAASEGDVAEATDTQSSSEQLLRRFLLLPDSKTASELPLRLVGELRPVAFDLPFEQAVARAMNKRNDLIAARLQVEIAQRGVESAVGRFLPSLEIFANESVRSSYFSFDRRLSGPSVGASLQWSVWDGGMSEGRLRSARADRNATKLQLAQLEQTLVSSLRDLYATIERSRTLIRTQTSAAGYARRSLEQAQRLYELGTASLDDVLSSRLALTRSQVALQQAIYNYNASVAQVEYTASVQPPLVSPLLSPPTAPRPPPAASARDAGKSPSRP